MLKELNFLRRERQAVKGLGKRELPSNPDSTRLPFMIEKLSKRAKRFWDQRKYGAFAVSIFTDEKIKMVIGELGHGETQLFSRALIATLVEDDRQAVSALPEQHPDRIAFEEIYRHEEQRTAEITEGMTLALAEKSGRPAAEEATGLISKLLADEADDVKRIFFRKLTQEFDAVKRDQLIASRLRSRAVQIARIREQAIAKRG